MKFQDFPGERAGDPNLVFNMEESLRVDLGSRRQGLSFLGIVDFVQEGHCLGRLEMHFQK